MNLKISAAAVALSFASVATFAQSPAWPSTDESFAPLTQTRSAVRAELERASAQGELSTARLAYDVTAPDRSQPASPTRSQVRAEFEAARARGELDTGVLAYGAAPTVRANASSGIAAAHGAARMN